MTLCIAAACRDLRSREPRIVICADWMSSDDVSSTETEFKFEDLPFFVGMFAGVISDARELLSIYRSHLSAVQPPNTLHEWLETLREPLGIKKESQIKHLTGLIYDDLEPDAKYGVWSDPKHTTDVELLLAGFLKLEGRFQSLIFKTQDYNIHSSTKFLCIGIGSSAAYHSLCHRQQDDLMSWDQTLYHVYEAKKMGEQAPGVGKFTTLYVLRPKEDDPLSCRVTGVTKEGIEFLERCFKKYGPQDTKDLTFRDSPHGVMFWGHPLIP